MGVSFLWHDEAVFGVGQIVVIREGVGVGKAVGRKMAEVLLGQAFSRITPLDPSALLIQTKF